MADQYGFRFVSPYHAPPESHPSGAPGPPNFAPPVGAPPLPPSGVPAFRPPFPSPQFPSLPQQHTPLPHHPPHIPFPHHPPHIPLPHHLPHAPLPHRPPQVPLPHHPPHIPPHHHHPPPPNAPVPGGANTRAYYWVDTNARASIPVTAVHGGVDIDGTQIYVGRAFHDGDWIPAKVIPEKSVAYVAYDGKEIAVFNYQVLCEQQFDWIPAFGGNVPFNAVEGGRTSDGETLYIGRVFHEGSNTVGKVHPSHGSLYIPFNGEEIAYQNYEILVLR